MMHLQPLTHSHEHNVFFKEPEVDTKREMPHHGTVRIYKTLKEEDDEEYRRK